MGEESLFDAGILPEGVDESENALGANEIQDAAQQSIRQDVGGTVTSPIP
ncbi:hypothetical protein CfE428DRAFT_4888 [Chthoniobacter flavus Ellin428]|uniref:Uncharacterized protein n=1 Tax=Chthoniobacter flavus Ellin428 TaxID=497964 RepID=B4D7H3_9BACT|nr:hypothetical protein CfE428DRAFT_4888 [Chthoniobacter flavus Ellin428]